MTGDVPVAGGDIARAKIHARFKTLHEIPVPEWGIIIFHRPWTLDDEQKVIALMNRNEQLAFCKIIIMKSLNGDGSRMFKPDDKTMLLEEADAGLVKSIAERIIQPIPIEEAEKNSLPTSG